MGFLTSAKLGEYTGKLMTKLRTIFATKNMVGAPQVAPTVADMTDSDIIYVYTGSETGYTAGNWYYYDGSGWQSGGVYNAVAVVTDATLSNSGEAADAKATGDAIDRVFYPSAKNKLLEILRGIPYWSIDGAAEMIDELEAELFPEGDVVAIDAVYTQSGTVYAGAALDSLRPDLVVTATLSDSSTKVIQDYTITGTLTTGTSTVTVKYRDLTDTVSVSVSAAPTETGITAYYTQGQTVVTPYTPLASLKSSMTVMVNLSDTTSRELAASEYTLSGTLTEGTSTIDVAYNGFTDEITVTVSAAPTVPTGFDTDGLICCLDGKQIDGNLWYNLVSGVPFTLSNVIVETDGATFSGSADSIGRSAETFAGALTIEVVYKAASDSGNYALFGQHNEGTEKNLCLMHSKSSGRIFSCYNTTAQLLHTTSTQQNGILSATRGDSASPAQIAVLNGVEVSSTASTYTEYPSGGIEGSIIGSHGNSNMPFKGEILMVCLYNKRKTAAEMIANQAVYDSYYGMGVINAQS